MRKLAIAVAAVAGISALVALCSSAPQKAHSSPGLEMSVVGPGVEAVGDEFDVDVNVSQADSGYTGYQAYLSWDMSMLAYVDPPGVTYTGLGSMVLDATPWVVADGVRFGSARVSGYSYATGTAARVRLKCIGTGTSPLHLVSLVEDPAYGTKLGGPPGVPTWLVDDEVTCLSGADSDGDGCSEYQEAFGAPLPYPGSTCASPAACYSDSNWYDFYDVAIPAMPDPIPNGPRDHAVAMDDVLGVLFYVGTFDGDGGSPNANGVAYDVDKDADTVKDGQDYDRSPSLVPNPPWDAGPPSGAVAMDDVLVVLAQVGLSCVGPP